MIEYLRQLIGYHAWADSTLFECIDKLSETAYAENLHASMGGVRGTAVHMYGAEAIWLSRLKGISPALMASEKDFPTWAPLRTAWERSTGELCTLVESFTEHTVQQPVAYRTLRGETYSNTRAHILCHLVNHATYHRGQIVAMIRQLEHRGLVAAPAGHTRMEIPSLDLIAYFR